MHARHFQSDGNSYVAGGIAIRLWRKRPEENEEATAEIKGRLAENAREKVELEERRKSSG